MMQIEDKFIENIADNMRMYGISTTVGRVLGIIYINRNPMTLDELSEATGMSKTRMSQVVREMVDHNIAEKVFEKGVRKDIYNVEQDYYQTFISLFTSGWQRAIKRNRLVGKKLSAELANLLENETINEETEAKINDLLSETKEWLNYYDWLHRLVEFFDSGEVFNHVPKEK
ncbi:GbsR/MarR family transcriptional regulator [Oceanobacillus profundus]|uniref:HTH-type transcriptional regulator n=1 Tax=Oceanobacillus profundus TaxID=372463 RepID=A0A417YDZ9_9BACI|nr:GbsR/MarR family transcriptional regulator [Oceanobacillus profundus]MBR3120615.1 GbsR/MarR family transcriptional regulator [Oceanobacillus sp.]PAE28891.1 MarR family transcriptional regulator [Paenibacillus sp. 7884-2]MCM3397480.1 GbsR/MarR family transcriptional regulator [Oceanobacillus profundus]MDO6448624.1 GbsR/MarR family transcriptional regulator [Oceanobacillus profundus]RHW30877.1 GbsR/MarR family transcriptional regulator [Oceanobacillus profundus]